MFKSFKCPIQRVVVFYLFNNFFSLSFHFHVLFKQALKYLDYVHVTFNGRFRIFFQFRFVFAGFFFIRGPVHGLQN